MKIPRGDSGLSSNWRGYASTTFEQSRTQVSQICEPSIRGWTLSFIGRKRRKSNGLRETMGLYASHIPLTAQKRKDG